MNSPTLQNSPDENQPRKKPRQTRSAATVDAMFEATIQVLRASKVGGLTTTRVADRAGVSVGTLYQYFPHKNALLYAALQRHMEALAVALEEVCEHSRGSTIDEMAEALACGYIGLKVARAEDRRSLYATVINLGMDVTRARIAHRMDQAVANVLSSAADAQFDDATHAATTLMGLLRSSAHVAIEHAQDPAAIRALQVELTLSARRHLSSVARAREPSTCLALPRTSPSTSS